ncbi:MAG: hypothetical protein HQL44_04690 [Alphaproteobacteria bacterium]|nr:hypothetical protein [Alphaproteobacteria bacterium]
MPRRNHRYFPWLGLGVMLGFILSVELFFGSWFKAPGLWNLGIIRSVDWTIDVSEHYQHEGPIRYRRDYYGLRGSFGHPREIDLLVIGNSSTDQRNVAEGETWVDQLNACLNKKGAKVKTANAGVTGQTLRGLARNFDLWFNHIPGLKPKWVLAYFGVTEMDLADRDDSDDVRRYFETNKPPPPWKNLQNWIKMNSALNRLFSDARSNLKAWRRGEMPSAQTRPTSAGFRGDKAVDDRLAKAAPEALALNSQAFLALRAQEEERLQSELASFETRLGHLNAKTQAFGAQPIFVTQNSANYRVEGGKVWGDVRQFIRLRALAKRTMSYCAAQKMVCFDLSADLSLEDGDAYDGAHLTAKGSARVADYLCQRLSLQAPP